MNTPNTMPKMSNTQRKRLRRQEKQARPVGRQGFCTPTFAGLMQRHVAQLTAEYEAKVAAAVPSPGYYQNEAAELPTEVPQVDFADTTPNTEEN